MADIKYEYSPFNSFYGGDISKPLLFIEKNIRQNKDVISQILIQQQKFSRWGFIHSNALVFGSTRKIGITDEGLMINYL